MTTGVLLQDSKTYRVKKIQEELMVTGKGDSPLWKVAGQLSDFVYPWENERPSGTSFKALHSKDWLYCLFTSSADDIKVYVDKNDKTEVVNSERVELFFKIDDRLSPYYCLELDPNGRVFDYKAEYQRKFDVKWSWPAGQLLVKAVRTKSGYTVEIAISKGSLKELGLLQGKFLKTGLYRGECVELNGNEATLKWVSWVKPSSPTPDFHIPSSFGVLELTD